MKTKILSILTGALAIFLAACSNDLAPEPDAPSGKGDTFLRLEINKQDLTRAGLDDTSFIKGDRVWVVVRDEKYYFDLIFVTTATYNGEEWILQDQLDLSSPISGLEWTSATVQICAGPVEYDWGDRFAVRDLPFTGDILYGIRYGISKENPTAKVTCDHITTRLTFELKNNSDSPVNISKISLTTEGEQLFLGSFAEIDRGYMRVPYDISDWSTDFNNYTIKIPAGETTTLDFLIPPTEQAYEMMEERMEIEGISKTVFKFTLETEDRPINFDIEAQPWAPGRQYTYPVTLFYERKPIPDTDEYVDLGLSVLWAKCNVGATKPEEIGKFFPWGSTKGYEIGESYTESDLAFQASTPISELEEKGIVVYDPASVYSYCYNLTAAYDAATQNMGDPWRMPTWFDLKELVDNTSMNYVQKGEILLIKLTSKVPGFEDRYITLPAPGGYFKFGSFSKSRMDYGVWASSSIQPTPLGFPDPEFPDHQITVYGNSISTLHMDELNNRFDREGLIVHLFDGSDEFYVMPGFNVRAVRPLTVQ